jgi:hypothetical protein
MNKDNINKFTELVIYNKIKRKTPKLVNSQPLPVTDLVRHISTDAIVNAMKYLKIDQIQKKDDIINIVRNSNTVIL